MAMIGSVEKASDPMSIMHVELLKQEGERGNIGGGIDGEMMSKTLIGLSGRWTKDV